MKSEIEIAVIDWINVEVIFSAKLSRKGAFVTWHESAPTAVRPCEFSTLRNNLRKMMDTSKAEWSKKQWPHEVVLDGCDLKITLRENGEEEIWRRYAPEYSPCYTDRNLHEYVRRAASRPGILKLKLHKWIGVRLFPRMIYFAKL